MGIGRNDKIIRDLNGNLSLTAQFLFEEQKVILEVITKEDPLTAERAKKIELFKKLGYDVVVFTEDVFSSFEKFDAEMAKLQKKLGSYNEQELSKYKELRHQQFNELFLS